MIHRSRAWRRAQRRKHGGHTDKPEPRACWQEKPWRLLYFRAAKLKRAQQLGRFWPYREWERVLHDAEPIKVLFVCSKNQWRSPTAEAAFRKNPDVSVRSAGTSRSAKRTISVADIRWADLIFVMEDKHRARLRAQFRGEVRYKTIHVLDIPDLYRFMDPDLIEILQAKVAPMLRAN
ncbi:MAG: hypothetical protein AAGK80_10090 [Pseudomonadota bacterium]